VHDLDKLSSKRHVTVTKFEEYGLGRALRPVARAKTLTGGTGRSCAQREGTEEIKR
jgi:hypothetical protein